jgi:excisionase family DNA binding protein
MLDTTKEQLDRIEKKLDNPLNQVWFSISDVTRLTGLSRSTINRYISNGQLKSVKNCGKRMMRKEWVDKWIMG